jgi:hypothetical protein
MYPGRHLVVKSRSLRLGTGHNGLGLPLRRLKPLFKEGLGLGSALLLGLSDNSLGLPASGLETDLGLLSGGLKLASQICLFLMDGRQG